ncbi:MAG: hypothetical protein WKG01_11085 [Kofleriaceae bacterium]
MSRVRTRSLLLVALAGCAPDPYAFDKPTDVAFGREGDIYVADGYGNARIARFDASGQLVTTWGSRGSAPGQLRTPHGLAVCADGLVYVADRGNARIQVFDSRGRLHAVWRGPSIGRPWGISCATDGTLYVVDGGDQRADAPRGRLLRIDRSGRVLDRWSGPGLAPGEIDWGHDIAVGTDGSVFVVDVRGRRVQKFRRVR